MIWCTSYLTLLDCIGLGRGKSGSIANPWIGSACIGGSAGPREIGSDRIGNSKTWIGTALLLSVNYTACHISHMVGPAKRKFP